MSEKFMTATINKSSWRAASNSAGSSARELKLTGTKEGCAMAMRCPVGDSGWAVGELLPVLGC
jgi:hypothetical protein